jgi:hypothetical protein
MSATNVVCSQCGNIAQLISTEGQLFPAQSTERPMLFQIIDCPTCGEREQPDGHDGHDGPIDLFAD